MPSPHIWLQVQLDGDPKLKCTLDLKILFCITFKKIHDLFQN